MQFKVTRISLSTLASLATLLTLVLSARTVFADITDEIKSKSTLLSSCPTTHSFDYPVGKPNAKHYYNAQKFGKNYHLGEDWNGTGGGNTDFGDPVYAISDGIVSFSDDLKGGWGNVIRIYHSYHTKEGTQQKPVYIESLYAHLNTRLVKTGSLVKKGSKIGTIGNAGGIYLAHLHFEIRNTINMPIGQGYSKHTNGYIDPTKFIRSHRKIK
ncbi:MAG TPA: M23 family metallopeptidase [Leucothrix mucor]|nr:M23 family metallopeptidase [Leucothrix mucor]